MPALLLTYEQQIDKLVNEKNLVVNDRAAAMSALRDIGYFALINRYKWPLRNPMTRKYEDGTRFEDILALYHFDDDLRALLSGCLWRVERKLRNAVAHSFCERFGTDQAAYLDAANYSTARSACSDIRRLLGILRFHANDNMQHEYLVHQRTRHGNVPLWATLNAMTFGQVSKMYEILHPGVKAAVAKQFSNVNERQLANVLKVLVLFRNVCVHNERLFSHKVHSDIFDTPLHAVDVRRFKKLNYHSRFVRKRDYCILLAINPNLACAQSAIRHRNIGFKQQVLLAGCLDICLCIFNISHSSTSKW